MKTSRLLLNSLLNSRLNLRHAIQHTAYSLAAVLLAGCGSLLPAPVPAPTTYVLQRLPDVAQAQHATSTAPTTATATATASTSGPTLLVATPQAAPGYDSAQMAYSRQALQISYFARNEWIDTPARMLAPLIVATLQSNNSFAAVLQAPSAAAADLTLDTTVLRLQQNFNTSPSTVTFTLRASVMHNKTRRVLAWREFEQTLPAKADTPQAGVLAANLAVQAVLFDLARFCRAAAEAP
jgi:cholesterol transport system auxiliary component